MELPEQDRQALIEAARRRGVTGKGGAAFGVMPSSGKRPKEPEFPPGSSVLDVPIGGKDRLSDTVLRRRPEPEASITALPAPSMAQRHARSLEGYLTPKVGGPRARTVSQSLLGGQESVLPFGIGLQEFVPFSPYVGEEAGAMVREGQDTGSALTTGLGLGMGALQAFPAAKPLARGAKAAGKALGPKAAEMAEGYLQKSGLAPSVIKPKGGNWLAGTVEKSTEPLRSRGPTEADREWIIQHAENQRELGQDPARVLEGLEAIPRTEAINNWIDTKLNKYIRNEMGTPEDPVRKQMLERDIAHVPIESSWETQTLGPRRETMGFPAEGVVGQEFNRIFDTLSPADVDRYERAMEWERRADQVIENLPSKEWARLNPQYAKENPWMEKVDPDTMVYKASPYDLPEELGFEHLLDELRNAIRSDSDLPANLRLKREDLSKVTVPQAIERVAKINEWRAEQRTKADLAKARNPATFTVKEYPEEGMQWVEMKMPEAELPQGAVWEEFAGNQRLFGPSGESLSIGATKDEALRLLNREKRQASLAEALKYEGDLMGHCVGGYCPDVEYGVSRIYSLRDKKGEPRVTIEVKPASIPPRNWLYEQPDDIVREIQSQVGDSPSAAQMNDAVRAHPKYQADLAAAPPAITQIKGSGKKDKLQRLRLKGTGYEDEPDAYLLPFVQDFVRSGNWSKVADLNNAGLIKHEGKYLTESEMSALLDEQLRGPNYARGGLVTDTDAIAAKLKATGMDDEKALMQALRMADARQEAHMAKGGLLKALKGSKTVAGPQAKALETARKNAVKAGLSPDPKTRMLQLGFGPDWYHGSSGDIKAFRPDYLGESTGAQSAKKAYFFARDPQNPPPEMLEKSRDPKILQAFKRAGFSDEELAKLNEVSMKGHGAETASGYSAMGGSREYKEAMRKANAAEKAGKWDEYEKWMGIAEDSAIGRNQAMQRRVAEYGEKLDVMLDRINNTLLNKPLPQEEAVALDAKMKQLMPYGWYNSYSLPQMEALKGELVKLAGPDAAAPALKSIDDFMSVKANRMLEETYEEGSNVMPVALRYKNPMVHDYGGSSYRDESYSDLIDQAQALGHDALILKNTFDPGRGPAKLVDVAAVFKPEQVRSRFAAFDPARINESDLLGAADPALLAGVAVGSGLGLDAVRRLKREEQNPQEQKKAKGGLAKLMKGSKTIGNYQALPLNLPRAPNLPPQEITKTAERVARQQMGQHVRQSDKIAANLAGRSMKEVDRLKKLDIEIQPTKEIPTPTVVPEKAGEVRIALPGDISIADQMLMSVDNLPIGSQQEGGALFGFGQMDLENPSFWASNEGPAQQVQNKVTDVSNVFGTPDVIAMHLAMGHDAMNFAQHFADANLLAIQQMPVNPESARLFNEIVRAGNPVTGQKFLDFPGIENYKEAYEAMQKNPEMRKWFNNRMKVDSITQPLGLPSGKEIEYAIMEPNLRNMEHSLVGLSVGRMQPGASLIPGSKHKTYSHDIPGLALGRTQELLPVDLAFPDAAAHIRATQRPQDFTGTIQKVFPHQVVDDQYINQLGEYYTRLKQIRGYKKGGEVKKSGLSVLNEAII